MPNNNEKILEIANNIKLVAFDVDGVMTDGSLTLTEDGKEIKTYNAKDGLGVVMLSKASIITSIITAKNNNVVKLRADMIDIKELYTNQKDKNLALNDLMKKYNIKTSEVCYMGDDLPDLCVLEKVGLSACPNDAVLEVKNKCLFVSKYNGGRGAVRELCDLILKAKGLSYEILNKPFKQ